MGHFLHKTTAEFWCGAGLAPLVERFTDNLKTEVLDCQIDHQWTYNSDLSWFILEVVFRASINATFGPHLLFFNPTVFERHANSVTCSEHANSVNSIFWGAYHACRDVTLMVRLRWEFETCPIGSASENLAFNIQKLQQQPILGAVWAEVLRLYVATAMSRTPDRVNFKLGEWVIPKGKNMIMSA